MRKFITILLMLFLVSGCGLKIVKEDSQPEDLSELEQLAQQAEAATNTRIFHTLTGGGSGALDKTLSANLADGDISFVFESDGDVYTYIFNKTSSEETDSPWWIRPDDYTSASGVHKLTKSRTYYPVQDSEFVLRDLDAADFDKNFFMKVNCPTPGTTAEDCTIKFYVQEDGAETLYLTLDGENQRIQFHKSLYGLGAWQGDFLVEHATLPKVQGTDTGQNSDEVWEVSGEGTGSDQGDMYLKSMTSAGQLTTYIQIDSSNEAIVMGDSGTGEDLIWDFETATDDQVSVGTNSGTKEIDLSAINLVTTGTLAAGATTVTGAITATTSITATKFIAGGIIQYKDGAADGDIAALNDTASTGATGDPIELTVAELMGTTITNLGATGAVFLILPAAVIGVNTIFNVDVAQNFNFRFPAANDEGYWKAHDDTEFALGATGKDITCDQTPTIGDRVFLQTRKVASTIEYFIWSDCNGCIIAP